MNAINLRSRNQLKEPKGVQKGDNERLVEDQEKEVVEEIGDSNPKDGEQSKDYKAIKAKPIESYRLPMPFPKKLEKAKFEAKFGKFLEVPKKLHINICFWMPFQICLLM